MPLSFLGSALGAYVVYLLPEQLMKNVIVVLLVAVAVYTYRRKDWGDVSAVKQLGLAALLGSVVMAFGIGFYDGFFGPGTGSFLIFGFLFLGYDFVTAAGNAKALNFASGIGALLSFTLSGLLGVKVWICRGEVYGKRDLAPSFTAAKETGRRNDNAGGNRDKNFKRKRANR